MNPAGESRADRPVASCDLRGTRCPLTLRLVERELRPLAIGERLLVHADDPALEVDLPVWCERHGHRLLRFARTGDRVEAEVEKGQQG